MFKDSSNELDELIFVPTEIFYTEAEEGIFILASSYQTKLCHK